MEEDYRYGLTSKALIISRTPPMAPLAPGIGNPSRAFSVSTRASFSASLAVPLASLWRTLLAHFLMRSLRPIVWLCVGLLTEPRVNVCYCFSTVPESPSGEVFCQNSFHPSIPSSSPLSADPGRTLNHATESPSSSHHKRLTKLLQHKHTISELRDCHDLMTMTACLSILCFLCICI